MTGKRNTTWSADAWTFNYATLAIENGKGPDEFLSSAANGDSVTLTTGLDGESCFNIMPSGGRKVSLTLLQTSKGNAVLSALKIASDKIEGGFPAPLFIKDRLGTTLEISGSAMITKMPDWKAAKEGTPVVWEFLCADSDTFLGSH